MGIALELVTQQVTAPGSTFTTMVANTGDSQVVRFTSKKVRMLALWQQRQLAGQTRVVSPLLHDNVRGMQIGGSVQPDIGWMGPPLQELRGQDTLAVSGTGSAVAGDIELSSYLLRYDDLPGISGNFISYDDLIKRAVNRHGVRVALTSVATGQYGPAAAINSLDDAFKANTEYAIVGANIQNFTCAFGIKSPDWGNLRVGIPGQANLGAYYSDWFARLSFESGLACIPVFNSANKGQTFVDFADDENATPITVVMKLVELK